MQSTSTDQIVFRSLLVIGHLLPAVDKPLLGRRDAFLFLHLLLDLGNGVVGFDIEFDFTTGEGSDSARISGEVACGRWVVVLLDEHLEGLGSDDAGGYEASFWGGEETLVMAQRGSVKISFSCVGVMGLARVKMSWRRQLFDQSCCRLQAVGAGNLAVAGATETCLPESNYRLHGIQQNNFISNSLLGHGGALSRSNYNFTLDDRICNRYSHNTNQDSRKPSTAITPTPNRTNSLVPVQHIPQLSPASRVLIILTS